MAYALVVKEWHFGFHSIHINTYRIILSLWQNLVWGLKNMNKTIVLNTVNFDSSLIESWPRDWWRERNFTEESELNHLEPNKDHWWSTGSRVSQRSADQSSSSGPWRSHLTGWWIQVLKRPLLVVAGVIQMSMSLARKMLETDLLW